MLLLVVVMLVMVLRGKRPVLLEREVPTDLSGTNSTGPRIEDCRGRWPWSTPSFNKSNQQLQQQLSVADITALAGAVAIESAGGPFIPIQLGRIDATVADPRTLVHPVSMVVVANNNYRDETATTATAANSRSIVTATMPSAAFDSDGLRLYFQRLGLTEREWVALSGTHGWVGMWLLGMPVFEG
jgi:hypothetical protein